MTQDQLNTYLIVWMASLTVVSAIYAQLAYTRGKRLAGLEVQMNTSTESLKAISAHLTGQDAKLDAILEKQRIAAEVASQVAEALRLERGGRGRAAPGSRAREAIVNVGTVSTSGSGSGVVGSDLRGRGDG